ncbi:MAG: 4-hydroxy-tetrahydrodipicolinate reductase [Flavobacteriales bacterium]|nr:4-hydroxy-tetrahydrodipicolinate reductase [Flavobacteriales bacterium]MCB9447666.1 4-hydroxy-tetrahydrodipicolinate reductase [Flavobacteriales bacterium]
MNIAIIGLGKMGRIIRDIALERGHQVPVTIDKDNLNDLKSEAFKKADVAIEFTTPGTAVPNIMACLDAGVPVVVGTTGWMDHLPEISKAYQDKGGSLFYASNFSIGVNIFFQVNRKLAELMNPHTSYDVTMEEIHHIHKADAPSGTAITLAEGILENVDRKSAWCLAPSLPYKAEQLQIAALRTAEVPGTHTIRWESPIDDIEIKHTAKGRQGFALGAVIAAEWLKGRQGVFNMPDLLKNA